MLKRIIYTDFGQFIAALKSAERLGLHYRVERREISAVVKMPHFPTYGMFNPHGTKETTYTQETVSGVEYTLDILPDEAEAGDEQATA